MLANYFQKEKRNEKLFFSVLRIKTIETNGNHAINKLGKVQKTILV